MRILMTTDTVGGVWTYTRELVLGLLQRPDVHIALVTLGSTPSGEQKAWLDATSTAFGEQFQFTVTGFALEWQKVNAGAYRDVEPMLLKLAAEFRPDVLHSSQFCFGALPVTALKCIVAHSDVVSWHSWVKGGPPADSAWLRTYLALCRDGMRSADVVLAPSAAALEDLQHSFPFRAGSRWIHNGIDVEVPAAGERRLQAITAGRLWDEAKNITLLSQVDSPMPILAAGSRQHDAVSLSLQSLRGLQICGELPHAALLERFAESSIYVVTSTYEPFGYAAVEAARCGCAVLANDIAAQREVWGDGALFFQTAEELSNLLKRLAADPAMLAAAQQRSRERSERYTRRAMADAYFDYYQGVLTRPAEETKQWSPERQKLYLARLGHA